MKYKSPILFLFFTFYLIGAFDSKSGAIDSLKSVKLKNTQDRVNNYTAIASAYRTVNLDSAFFWAFKANKLVSSHLNKTVASANFHLLGELYSLRGQYEDSFEWFNKAYLLRKGLKNKKELLNTLINLVYTCQGLGDVKKAHPLAIEAEKLCVDLNLVGTKVHLSTLCQLSDVYVMLKRYDKAEEFLKIAVKETEASESNYNKAVIYHNYGTFLLKLFKYSEARQYFEKAIELVKVLKDESWLYDLNFNLGIIYAETGNLNKAEQIFLESYDIEMSKSAATADNYAKSKSAKNIGYVVMKKKEYSKALKYFMESLYYAKEAGANDLLADRYMSVSEALEAMKKFKEALAFRKKYENLKDSVFNLETTKQLNELSEKFDTEKKEKRILLLNKRNTEIKLKELQSKKELSEEKTRSARRNILFASLIFMVLLIAGFIYYSLVQKRKAHLKLEDKNKEIQLQHELLEEKQKEIIDSINYAKRIQQSLLPTQKFIAKNLNRLKNKQ